MKHFGVLAFAWFASDRLSKSWVASHLHLYERVPFLGQSFLVLSRTLNKGLAFDSFSWIPEPYISPYIRYLPSLIWLGLATLVALRWHLAARLERSGYALMISGGASNLFDHWRDSYVTDTIQLYIGRGNYMPMNLADIALVTGLVLVVLGTARELFGANPRAVYCNE